MIKFSELLRSEVTGHPIILAYAPAFKYESAGVFGYYQTLRYLQYIGFPVFLILETHTIGREGYYCGSLSRHSRLPILDAGALDFIIGDEQSVVVLYTDSQPRNILNADKYVTFLNYFDGQLTGVSSHETSEAEQGLVFFGEAVKNQYFAKNAARSTDNTTVFSYPVYPMINTDDQPHIDISLDTEPSRDLKPIEYYYGNKYLNVFNRKIPENILRRAKPLPLEKPNKFGVSNVEKYLRQASVLHVFEETALSYQARMVGTPVNFHPDGVFSEDWIGPLSDSGALRDRDPSTEVIQQASMELTQFCNEIEKWEGEADRSVTHLVSLLEKHKTVLSVDSEKIILGLIRKSQKAQMRATKKKIRLITVLTFVYKRCKKFVPSSILDNLKPLRRFILRHL